MSNPSDKLTPMQSFALDVFKRSGDYVTARRLSYLWCLHGNKSVSGNSREMFGVNVAVSRCLRQLHRKGYISVTVHGGNRYYSLVRPEVVAPVRASGILSRIKRFFGYGKV